MTDTLPKLNGALLTQFAATARRELLLTNDWPGWVERMRPTLPHKTRNADTRHPTNPRNDNRDWTQPPTERDNTRERNRWSINVSEDHTAIAEIQHDQTYRVIKRFAKGTEQALADYLIDRGIEVEGLPKHGGTQGGGDAGFSAALGNAIDEERARVQQRTP